MNLKTPLITFKVLHQLATCHLPDQISVIVNQARSLTLKPFRMGSPETKTKFYDKSFSVVSRRLQNQVSEDMSALQIVVIFHTPFEQVVENILCKHSIIIMLHLLFSDCNVADCDSCSSDGVDDTRSAGQERNEGSSVFEREKESI